MKKFFAYLLLLIVALLFLGALIWYKFSKENLSEKIRECHVKYPYPGSNPDASCITDLAMKYSNVTICGEIKWGSGYIDDCYLKTYISIGNTDNCYLLRSSAGDCIKAIQNKAK